MNHLLYLAGSITFVFCFFFFGTKTGDNPSFVYLQYGSLIIAFYFLLCGIKYWSDGKAPSMTSSEASSMRREKWRQQKIDRKKRRQISQ